MSIVEFVVLHLVQTVWICDPLKNGDGRSHTDRVVKLNRVAELAIPRTNDGLKAERKQRLCAAAGT